MKQKQIALHKIKVASEELAFGSPKKNKTPKGFVGWLEMNIGFLEEARKIFVELHEKRKGLTP